MKNLYLIPTLLVLVACNKSKTNPDPTETPVQKFVEYKVFAEKDYSAPQYAGVTAEIRLVMTNVSRINGETKVIWDSIINPRGVATFPLETAPIIIRKQSSVIDSKEKLNASFGIKYRDGQYIMQEGISEDLIQGQTEIKLDVAI